MATGRLDISGMVFYLLVGKTGDSDLVFVGPKKYVVPRTYKKCALDIYNFEARPDDIYLVGCQRTGTTPTREMVWLIENDLDFEGAAKDLLDYRFPRIDFGVIGTIELIERLGQTRKADDAMTDIVKKYQELNLKDLSQRKGKRLICSQLPLTLLSPHIFEVGAKIIYCARNPKDVLVSLYNLYAHVSVGKSKNFRTYIDDFKADTAFTWPYIEHVKEAWDRKNNKNFLFLFYEDFVKDKRVTIQKISDFLGKNLSSEQINSLEDHLSIDKFRENKSVNLDHLVQLGVLKDVSKFIRKGKSGSWKELFGEELEKEFDQVLEKKLEGTDLRFPNS